MSKPFHSSLANGVNSTRTCCIRSEPSEEELRALKKRAGFRKKYIAAENREERNSSKSPSALKTETELCVKALKETLRLGVAMEFLLETTKMAWTQYNYSRSLEENLDVLKAKMQELSSREADVKIELNKMDEMRGKKLKQEVSLWLENVEKITSEVTKIEEDTGEVARYFSLSRVALGKLVVKKIDDVVKLRETGRFSEGLFTDLLCESGSMPATKLVGKMTAERNLEQIWELLMDHNVSTIGVFGMGGVGKTTIMTHVYNKVTSSGIFGIAIWVTVSNDFSIGRLQNSIARAIGLELYDEEDEMRRSMKLSDALEYKKKFIIILDDMWKAFPLVKVGIPEGNAYKVVLTTRSKNVCRAMKCQEKIKVEVLSREEEWELFKERFGADVVLSGEIETIAKLVTEECGGLPLGIITVASAMREKDDVREWRNALQELKCSTMEIEGMDDQVFPILKFSYDRLKSERIQACFLCCALFPEDHAFFDEELIEYWRAEGLMDDMGDWEKELDKGQTILNQLIDVCMLVRRFDHRVVMHDLIRDLAIGITRKSPRFVVKAGTRIRGSIGGEEFTEDVDKISLMRNEIEMLSGEPNCPKLSTLLLQHNPLSGNISHSFFNRMNSLRVLNLSDTCIEYLPVSVSNLENLCILLLNNCKRLREVPSLAKLKRLRLLNLSYTAIKELPHGMECLVNLKELYVLSEERFGFDWYVSSGHWNCLKRFRIVSKSHNFTFEAERMDAIGCNIIGKESSFVLPDSIVGLVMDKCQLSSLPCLSCLRHLRKCKISSCSMKWLLPIGDNPTITSLPLMQSLCLKELQSFRGITEGVLLPGSFACLKLLIVYRCHVLVNLLSLELFQHLQCLEQIDIEECSEMEEVIQGEGMVEEGDNNNNNNAILLPNLRELYLMHLGKLKSICKRVIICPSLNKISIADCGQLKKFPLSLGSSTPVVRGKIEGSKEWWNALEWEDPNTKTLLQPLFQEHEEEDGRGMRREGRGMKRKAEEVEQIASTSRQQESPY
ncbi:probable disease resistance protein At1g61300 [Magnolia sinica]|uniref:probable disease resistance protein At1g61300 n=1 Tax=Magnolia sinica TaxID=86752 RepID=UPI0026593507|nr:probable disease resistance protein At1g61300 [Magnolia sinica]